MGLHQRRTKRLKFGFPELVAILLLLLALIPAGLWWLANLQPDWRRGDGHVVACQLARSAYSNNPYPDQVDMTYEYTVSGARYTGHWRGFWPHTHSPNALPNEQLDRLRQPGYSLVVMYNPSNPSQSRLHYRQWIPPVVYECLCLAALILSLLYFSQVYPNWKTR